MGQQLVICGVRTVLAVWSSYLARWVYGELSWGVWERPVSASSAEISAAAVFGGTILGLFAPNRTAARPDA